MTKEEFEHKFYRYFDMWAQALKNRDLQAQKAILNLEKKLINEYQLSG